MSDEQPNQQRRRPANYVAQGLFVAWLAIVNVLYYLQFKSLFLARLASLVHR